MDVVSFDKERKQSQEQAFVKEKKSVTDKTFSFVILST